MTEIFPRTGEECQNILGLGFWNNTDLSSDCDFHFSACNIRQVIYSFSLIFPFWMQMMIILNAKCSLRV